MFFFNKDKIYGPKGKTVIQKQIDVVCTFGWREGEYMLLWNSEVIYCAITLDGIFYKQNSNVNAVCIPIYEVTDIEYINQTISNHHGYNWGKAILHKRDGGVFELELPISELSSFESGWGETPNPEFWDEYSENVSTKDI